MRNVLSLMAVFFCLTSLSATDKRSVVLVELASPSVLGAYDENQEANFEAQAEIVQREQSDFLYALKNKELNVDVRHKFQKSWNGISLEISDADRAEIESLPHVVKVWNNEKVSIPENKLTYFGPEGDEPDKMMPSLNVQEIWKKHGLSGKGVTIAVHDTGIDYTHPDLGGCLGPKCKVIGGYDIINEDKDPIDDHFHGTHVAAIAAGNGKKMGVAPEAKLIAYKVLSKSGSGSWEGIIRGVEMSVDPNGDGKFDDAPDVQNFSLGGGGKPSSPLGHAVNAAARVSLMVMAAGNSGPGSKVGMPAGARGSIAVGATDEAKAMASFSSNGPTEEMTMKPDVSAPGVKIWSATLKGKYRTASGTSMASPFVAGLAALIVERFPVLKKRYDRTPIVRSRLSVSAKPFKIEGMSLINSYFRQGHGLVDPLASIENGLSLTFHPSSTQPENHVDMGVFDMGQSHLARIIDVQIRAGVGLVKKGPFKIEVEHDLGKGLELDYFPKVLTTTNQRIRFRVRQSAGNIVANDKYPNARGIVLKLTRDGETLRVPMSTFPISKIRVLFDEKPPFTYARLIQRTEKGIKTRYIYPKSLKLIGDKRVAEFPTAPGSYVLKAYGNGKEAYNYFKKSFELKGGQTVDVSKDSLVYTYYGNFVDPKGGTKRPDRVRFVSVGDGHIGGLLSGHTNVRLNEGAAAEEKNYMYGSWMNGDTMNYSGGRLGKKGGLHKFGENGYVATELKPEGDWPGMFCQYFRLLDGTRSVGWLSTQNLAHRANLAKGEWLKDVQLQMEATGAFDATSRCGAFGNRKYVLRFDAESAVRRSMEGATLWRYPKVLAMNMDMVPALPVGNASISHRWLSTRVGLAADANGMLRDLPFEVELRDGTGKVIKEGIAGKSFSNVFSLKKGKYTLIRKLPKGLKSTLDFDFGEPKKLTPLPSVAYFDRKVEGKKTRFFVGSYKAVNASLEVRSDIKGKWVTVDLNDRDNKGLDFDGEVDFVSISGQMRLVLTDEEGNRIQLEPNV